MLGFKSFRSAGNVLAGIELMPMIRQGQFTIDGAAVMSFADRFIRWQGKCAQCKRRHAQHGKIRARLNTATGPSSANYG